MSTDTKLQKNVIDELAWDPALQGTEVGVSAKDGVITLTGTVSTYVQRFEAEKAVQRVTGVRAVADELTIQLLPVHKHNDTELAHEVLRAFQWNVSVPDQNLQIDVRDGWVTINGQVEWEFQRRAADAAVRHLAGVRGVTNAITVRPRVSAANVKEKIEAAIKRHAELDAKRIQVATRCCWRIQAARRTRAAKAVV